MTEATRTIIGRLFVESERGTVEMLLARECGGDLPLTGLWGEAQFERLWFAILKLSEGDLGRLRQTIALARVDWRDVLVGAGFGSSLEAHRQWARQLTS